MSLFGLAPFPELPLNFTYMKGFMFVLSTTFRYLVMMFLSSFTLVHVVKPKHGASH
jgi:hypothetical protein